jgi:hypothetical protein
LIAGGTFSSAGLEATSHIAGWNGSSWASLNIGMNAPVRALLPFESDLMVGGDFTRAGAQISAYWARWSCGEVQGLHLVAAASRRTHGGSGDFDLPLSLSTAQLDPRANGAAARIVLRFDGPAAASDGQINCGQEILMTHGTCEAVTGESSDTLVVELTLDQNACVTVAVSGLLDLVGASEVRVLTHEGNVTGDEAVNLLDLQAVKADLFNPVTGDSFLSDVNCDGAINLLDLQTVKANLFQPAACP